MATQANYGFAKDQSRAARTAKSTQDGENHGENQLLVSDDFVPTYKLYIYNILNLQHIRRLPPNFPRILIPACLPNEKFSFTTLPAVVRNRFNKPQTFEYYYSIEDGRKSASQILNPAGFPGIVWERQLVRNSSEVEFYIEGSNLNEIGCFWSQTRPQDQEQLDQEIKLFRDIATQTMQKLAKKARALGSDPKKVNDITPMMHFAMDYLGLKAPWHVDTYAIINCPTCGEEVRQGIVYHRNSMGDRCIVDLERAQKMGLAPVGDLSQPEKLEPAIVSSQPFDVHEIEAEQTEEDLRDKENKIIADAREIMEKRQKLAAKKRADTIAAKKKALNSDPTVDTPGVAQAAAGETGTVPPPPPDKEGFE
jgi:hypothetical protein